MGTNPFFCLYPVTVPRTVDIFVCGRAVTLTVLFTIGTTGSKVWPPAPSGTIRTCLSKTIKQSNQRRTKKGHWCKMHWGHLTYSGLRSLQEPISRMSRYYFRPRKLSYRQVGIILINASWILTPQMLELAPSLKQALQHEAWNIIKESLSNGVLKPFSLLICLDASKYVLLNI